MYDNASNFTRTGDTKDDKMYTQQMHTKDADADGDGATRMTTEGGRAMAADGWPPGGLRAD